MWRTCAAASTAAPSPPTRSRILVHSRDRTASSDASWKVAHMRAVRSIARVPLPAFPMSTTATTSPSRTRTLLGVEISAWTMSGAPRGGGTPAHASRRRSTKASTSTEYPGSRPMDWRRMDCSFVSLTSGVTAVDRAPVATRQAYDQWSYGSEPWLGLKFDDVHQALDERRGELWRWSRVDEVHQVPHVSGCGPYREPCRCGIAAATHVLDHSLSSQRLVQLIGVGPGHCLENCSCPP